MMTALQEFDNCRVRCLLRWVLGDHTQTHIPYRTPLSLCSGLDWTLPHQNSDQQREYYEKGRKPQAIRQG